MTTNAYHIHPVDDTSEHLLESKSGEGVPVLGRKCRARKYTSPVIARIRENSTQDEREKVMQKLVNEILKQETG